MSILRKNMGLLVLIVLSFWAIKPLFTAGFFPMHDDTQVARVFEMGKMLKDGVFPVRWVPDLGYGYGYPIFNFYAPLAYYVGGFFTLLGFDALTSTKIMMILGIFLSGVFMYLLAREFWGELGGIVSGLFYVYAPFHAVDIYVRGDVAEFWAYAFIPLVFYGIYKVYNSYNAYKKDHWKWIVVGAFGYAGVILSHNLTAMMVTPFLIIVILLYCYIAYKKKKPFTIYHLPFTILLGLMLSAFYWMPALLEMKYTNVLSQIGGGADFRDHFVCISQLWQSDWGFGGSIPGCIDGLSFRVGKFHILSILISLTMVGYYIFRHSGKSDRTSDASRISMVERDSGQDGYQTVTRQARMTGLILLSILAFGISVFLMLDLSRIVWEAIYPMSFFQFPWRFLLLASFFSSLLAGLIVWFFSTTESTSKESRSLPRQAPYGTWPRHLRGVYLVPVVTGLSIVVLLFFNIKLFQPQTILPKTSSDYTNEIALKWTASKISDEFLPPNFKRPQSEREIARGSAVIPEQTLIQNISNIITLTGIVVVAIGIIIGSKKRLSV